MTQPTNGMTELTYSEETFRDMYEALQTTIIHPQSVVVDTLSNAQCRAELKRVCRRIDAFKDIANQALAKAEGKE